MDKTLDITLTEGMNTKLSTCDDKGVFTDDGNTVSSLRWVGGWLETGYRV